MKLSGSYRFEAPRARVWETLMDPAVVGACLPGVRSFTPVGPDAYAIEVGVRVGIVSGTYRGTLEVVDKAPPSSYRMTVTGAGARTTIAGAGTVELAEEGEATALRFAGDVQVTGVLARVGQRLMDGAARSQIDRFFACMQAKAAARP